MLHEPFGPAGAGDTDFWTDIPEGADMLPGTLPGEDSDAIGTLNVLGGAARLNAAEPASPNIFTNMPVLHDRPDGEGGRTERIDNAYGILGPADDDPLGSWTGVPADEDEAPTQDADDL